MPTIYFASNRDVNFETSKDGSNFGNRFNVQGPQCFRVGEVEVKLARGGDPKKDDEWTVGRCKLYPERLRSTSETGPLLGSARLFEGLRRHLKETRCDVIIYLHGFANDFPNSVKRAAALQELYGSGGEKAAVVMFSWPSNGEVFPSYNYFSDREDAEMSGIAMGRALKRFTEFLQEVRDEDFKTLLRARRQGKVPPDVAMLQCERKIHLVAHSMGNWALRHAVLNFARLNEARLPRLFDHAFLMAADEDADALQHRHKLGCLVDLANMVHVYHARDDVALEVSDKTKGNPNRLGSDGPENLDLIPERVIAIDCREVSDTIASHGRHQYYRLRTEVIDDVVATLNGVDQENRKDRITVRPGRSWRLQDQS